MKLGLVTYQIGQSWDLPTLIEKCKAVGIEGVELRTTHAHGVEPSLSKAERVEVRKRFEDSGITLWCLGSICEFHSDDPAVVRQNIETCKEFTVLAQDLGAVGVKVRPNGLQLDKGIPEEQTMEQIGLSMRECGEFAVDYGIEIWCEVHGYLTQDPPRMRKILDICNHNNVGACWNSNGGAEISNSSVKEAFELLKKDIRSVHLHELCDDYPYREFFSLLKESGYDRYTLAEIGDNPDGERLLRYYKALWLELTR